MWYFIPNNVPADNQLVWVRLYNGYEDAFEATYNATLQNFTFSLTNIIYPVWMIAKWKAV